MPSGGVSSWTEDDWNLWGRVSGEESDPQFNVAELIQQIYDEGIEANTPEFEQRMFELRAEQYGVDPAQLRRIQDEASADPDLKASFDEMKLTKEASWDQMQNDLDNPYNRFNNAAGLNAFRQGDVGGIDKNKHVAIKTKDGKTIWVTIAEAERIKREQELSKRAAEEEEKIRKKREEERKKKEEETNNFKEMSPDDFFAWIEEASQKGDLPGIDAWKGDDKIAEWWNELIPGNFEDKLAAMAYKGLDVLFPGMHAGTLLKGLIGDQGLADQFVNGDGKFDLGLVRDVYDWFKSNQSDWEKKTPEERMAAYRDFEEKRIRRDEEGRDVDGDGKDDPIGGPVSTDPHGLGDVIAGNARDLSKWDLKDFLWDPNKDPVKGRPEGSGFDYGWGDTSEFGVKNPYLPQQELDEGPIDEPVPEGPEVDPPPPPDLPVDPDDENPEPPQGPEFPPPPTDEEEFELDEDGNPIPKRRRFKNPYDDDDPEGTMEMARQAAFSRNPFGREYSFD